MSGPDFSLVADGVGHVLAFLLAWAALFVVGPIACVVLLVLQAAGVAAPAGSGWLYAGTASAWLLALGAWAAGRAIARAVRRVEATVAEWTRPFAKARPRRVIVVDAATGATIPGAGSQPPASSGWDWGARREREFRDWSDAAARVRSVLHERAREAPRTQAPRPDAQARPRAHASPPPPRPEPRARPQASQPPAPPPPPAAPDPWRVLGISRGSSQDAIRSAYRDLVKQYHPDRVAGMPREFQSIAHEKTREIREAYETLKRAPKR